MGYIHQFVSTLLLLLRLKSWRAVIGLVTAVCIMSILFIYPAIEGLFDRATGSFFGVERYGMDELTSDSSLLADTDQESVKRLMRLVASRNGNEQWITACDGSEECFAQFNRRIHSSLDNKMLAMLNASSSVYCNGVDASELLCPYILSLQYELMSDAGSFASSEVIKMISQQASNRHEISVGELQSIKRDSSGQCNSRIFPLVFPIAAMVQLILAASGVILYIIMSCVSPISNLKSDGFQQLMVRNGLSVSAYWAAIWLVTLVEMLIFSGLLMLCFTLWCPGGFTIAHLLSVSLCFLLFCLYLAAIAYLTTVLLRSYFLILLIMILVNVVVMVLILLSRLLFSTDQRNVRWQYVSLFVMPATQLAEFILPTLAPSNTSLTSFPTIAIPITLLVYTIIIIIITIYLDFLLQNGNGLRLSPSFLFNGKFWSNACVSPMLRMEQMHQGQEQQQQQQLANVEPVSDNCIAALRVAGVSKTYSSRTIPCSQLRIVKALNDVSGIIYQDQITALIGHNGAGKTTLIKVLLGDETADCGTATLGNCDMIDSLQRMQLRSSIGVCYQGNVLCSQLTVQQCIDVMLMCKGLSANEQANEVNDLLQRLGLDDKRSSVATEMSGGQQRKLCTLLALIGKPKVIFLDEPTSGLDPVSRRRLWQILQEYKVGRSIILCTQFMDEADILADRKVFLSGGSLICAGSSLFLKYAFGCGFVFNVSVKQEADSDKLMQELTKVCSSVQLKTQFRTELELAAPPSESASLPALLQVLEQRTDIVDAFGLSQATLDDIFMQMKDVDAAQIVESFQAGQLSSFMLSQRQLQQQKAADDEAASMASTTETTTTTTTTAAATAATAITKGSKPKQLVTLVGMNMLRLRRARGKLCCRLIFPVILLLALVAGVLLERNIGALPVPILSLIRPSFMPVRNVVCLHENHDNNPPTMADCKRALGGDQFTSSVVVNKSAGILLSDWLTTKEATDIFNKSCSTLSFVNCPFAYASAWSKTLVNNNNRSVSYGIYRDTVEGNLFNDNIYSMSIIARSIVSYFSINNQTLQDIPTVVATPYTSVVIAILGCSVLMILLSIIPVTYISDPVEDRESRVRQQLNSMGMSSASYWLNTFLLHYIQYAVFLLAAMVIMSAMLPDRYANAYLFVGIFLPLLTLGLTSNQLTAYAVGSLLNKPNPLITVVYFFFVLFLSLSVQLIQLNSTVSLVMIWCVPPFAAVSIAWFGLKLMFYEITFYSVKLVSELTSIDIATEYVHNPYILHSILANIVHIVLLLLLISAKENWQLISNSIRSAFSKKSNKDADAVLLSATDIGVQHENNRIKGTVHNADNAAEVRQLRKIYPNGVTAVQGVSFGPIAGEIFGLLGPNGAGKTTTLSIVVGEETATAGSCEVNSHGNWMTGNTAATNGAVGYCPQHNPLFENITTKEHLLFYAKIRGVPANHINQQINDLLLGLSLNEHKDKQSQQLSGGNKRRLCLAISLLGNPSVVVIDEASTGVDPAAKRFIWKAIRKMAHHRRALVVTTHSMEEVEALCTRVGIMNHGCLIGFGTVQQLRSRYGNAYTLDILMIDNTENEGNDSLVQRKKNLVNAVLQHFTNSQVVEELHTRLQFQVPQSAVKNNKSGLSAAVQWLTDQQAPLHIQYFSFYQMSLDQVFVQLIKQQEEREQQQLQQQQQQA